MEKCATNLSAAHSLVTYSVYTAAGPFGSLVNLCVWGGGGIYLFFLIENFFHAIYSNCGFLSHNMISTTKFHRTGDFLSPTTEAITIKTSYRLAYSPILWRYFHY